MKHNLKTRLLSLLLCISMIVPVVAQKMPVVAEGETALSTEVTNPFRSDVSFVVDGEKVTSNSYRIPSMVTLADGTIVAAADIRWNTTYDGGGLDTLVARSTDGGVTWSYTVANYLGDNGNEYNYNSTTFIDPSLIVAEDGHTVYMLVDLYAYGVALNGLWETNTKPYFSYPSADTGFDVNGNLKLSADNHSTYGYYLKDGKIYANESTNPEEGYEVDEYFNITYTANGETVTSNLFFSDSPFKVARTQFLYLTKSTDGGATWSAPTLLNLREEAGEVAANTDEDALLVSPGNAITTSGGVMVYPVYSYAHYTNSSSVSNSYQHMGLIYSTDGVNWERTENFTGVNVSSEGSVIELENGNLRVFFRNETGYLCYVDYDFQAKTWQTHVQTEVPTNSNTQMSAITYSKTSDGKQVVLISCPTGPNENGSTSGNGAYRTNGKIHVFTIDADGNMELKKQIKLFDVAASDALSGSDYLEESGFFAYSALTERSDGSIAILYENNQIGWGAGDGKYYTIDIASYPSSDLGIPLDEPQNIIVDANGDTVDSITMSQYEKPELTANAPFPSVAVAYQWQIEYEDGKWVDIYGETSKTVKISYGMVATLLDADGKVDIRCKSQFGTSVAYSKPITVTIEMYQPEEPDVVVSESLTTSSGEVVTVTVAGSIPEDASVQLEEAEPEGVDVGASETVVASLDISIKNADGTEWQPESGETVTVTLEASKLGLKDGDTFVVYHLHDGEVKILGGYTVEDDTVSFEVDGFSLFVFALAEQTVFTDDLQSDVGKTATINDEYNYFSAVADPTVEEWNMAMEGIDYSAGIEFIITDVYVSSVYPYNIYYKVEVKNGELLSDFVINYPWIYQGRQDEDPSFATLILQEVPEEPAEPAVDVTVDGEPVSEISVSIADKVTLNAALNVEGTTTYQWQLLIPSANMWVNISGQTSAECTVNYGMVANRLDDEGKAHVRCVVTVDGVEITCEPVAVSIISTYAHTFYATRTMAYATAPLAEGDTTGKYYVNVYCYIGDSDVLYGKVQSMEFGVTEEARDVSFDIAAKAGYTPYYFETSTLTGKENGTVITTDKYTIENFKPESDMTLIVRYYPNEDTPYKVEHYIQNIDDDGYTLHSAIDHKGTTDEAVPGFYDSDSLEMVLDGFYAMPYSNTKIASDGGTVIQIYYDRYMYLMLFDLGEGGMGVEPIYGRHGVEYKVGTPKRLGYTFDGWVDENGNTINVTTTGEYTFTIPAKDITYMAKWKEDNANYTIVFWRADLDDGDAATPTTYSYWGSATIGSVSGTVLTPSTVGAQNPAEDINDANFDNEEATYFTYDAEKTAQNNPATVTVAGDGSTIINVYYSRKSYQLIFYYARTNTSGNSVNVSNTTGSGYRTTGDNRFQGMYWGDPSGDGLPAITDSYFTSGEGWNGYHTIGNYRYYYLAFEAEFEANIEDEWPANSLSSLANGIWNFGSWAAESGSEYRKKDSAHANIVGAYPYLTADLIVDPDAEIGHHFVAWWGQEGRSSSQNDNVAAHYYHIYYEVLPGQENDADAVPYTYNGVTKYYKLDRDLEFNAAHKNSSPTRVDAFEYDGYKVVGIGEDSNSADNMNNLHGHYCNTYYYDREVNTLSFYNHNEATNAAGKKFPDAELMFGQLISDGLPKDKVAPYEPPYPEGLDAGGYTFKGWYTSPGCYDGTEVNWSSPMPAGDLMLYAKWEPVEHTIEFYFDETLNQKLVETDIEGNDKFTMQTVLHNQYGKDPGLPGHPMDFDAVTWFYKDASGEEKTFDFSMQVKQDMKLYPKWRSTVFINYEIRYKIFDQSTNTYTDIEIAAPTYGQELYGETITVTPKGTEEFYDAYRIEQNGYFPMTGSHSIVMGESQCSGDPAYTYCTWDEETKTHVFTYYYVNGPKVPYTVKYHLVDADGNFLGFLFPEKYVEGNYKAKVVENAEIAIGYKPDAAQKTLYVVFGEMNEIIFNYTVDENASWYTVTHYVKKYGSTEYEVYEEYRYVANVGDKVSEYKPTTIPGCKYIKTEVSDSDYTVRKGTADDPGFWIALYYDEEPVTIKYEVMGDFGGTVSNDEETIGIVYGTAVGSTASPSSSAYKFVGWYDANGNLIATDAKFVPKKVGSLHVAATYYAKFEYNLTSLTIDKAFPDGADYSMDVNQSFLFDVVEVDKNGTAISNGVNLTVTVHGDGSITIDRLTVGSYYKITEQTDWSWRYNTCVPSSDLADANEDGNSITVQLNADTNIVTFTNTRSEEKWLDGDSYKVNIFGGNN